MYLISLTESGLAVLHVCTTVSASEGLVEGFVGSRQMCGNKVVILCVWFVRFV